MTPSPQVLPARHILVVDDDSDLREQVSAYLREKQMRPAFRHTEVWGEEHAYAFTVAKAVQADTAFMALPESVQQEFNAIVDRLTAGLDVLELLQQGRQKFGGDGFSPMSHLYGAMAWRSRA